MHIKLDENLPAELADDLRALGHEVDTVVAEGLTGGADAQVAAAAQRGARCLFTLDKGLGDVRRFPPRKYAGIVVFRFSQRGRGNVRKTVRALLPSVEKRAPLDGRLLVVSEASIRVKK